MRLQFLVILFSTTVLAAPVIKPSELLKAMADKTVIEFNQKLEQQFSRYASKVKPPLSQDGLRSLECSLDYQDFVIIIAKVDSPKYTPLYKWLATNYKQMTILVRNLSDEDRLDEVIKIVDKLCAFDPSQRKELFQLITAIAVVWDRPRGNIHGQMGRKILSYKDQEITELYRYFKKLYLSTKAAVKFDRLTVGELIFVVETPVPITELEWALKNERGNASSWGKKYGDIEYDTPRLDANEMSWPSYNGDYSLKNIEEHGGICVDQAYYATVTARAHGIPAMYFGGNGRRGGHAWFGHFVKEGEWKTDIGQYSGDNYAVGYTQNPQTNKKMTDHEVEFSCQRKLRSKSYATSLVYSRAAKRLVKLDQKTAAYRFASVAINTAPLCQSGWTLKEQLLIDAKKSSQLLSLYKSKQAVFKKYPDVAAETKLAYANLLDKSGRDDEATKLRKQASKKLGKDRTDINIATSMEQFEALVKKKKQSKALKVIEKLIWDNREERAIVFGAMSRYLSYTKKVGAEKAGLRFIKKVYSKMVRNASQLEIGGLMGLMIRAYENTGDLKGVQKIKKELLELEEDKAKRTKKNRKKEKRRGEGDDDEYDHE